MAASSLSPRLASSPSSPEQKHFSFPVSLISFPQRNNLHFSKNLYKFSTWNGLKQLNMPTSPFILKLERKRRCKGVFASLFGVGAPEALVIGVVALLVFGPKGLAEVARNLGKTLRDFQPTIRELQEVSRDFKSTLEREIGLDEIQETTRRTPATRPTAKPEDFVKDNTPTDANPTENKAYTSEEYLSSITEQLKRQREKEASESLLNQQVTDGSAFSKEAETQEYLKQLEEQVQTLLAEKQKQTATAEVKPEDTLEDASESPSRNSENQA